MIRLYDPKFQESHSLEELEALMESGDMTTFTNTCAFLRRVQTQEGYELLKRHIDHPDLYKRRFVLATIFHFPQAQELVSHLEAALNSGKSFLAGTALDVVIRGMARIPDNVLLAYMEQHPESLSRYACSALESVEKNPENARRVLKMYCGCRDESIRIGLAEVLYSFCSNENHMEYFDLFRDEPVPHIRILACRIAKEYHRPELLQTFAQDRDGHIRKLADSQ